MSHEIRTPMNSILGYAQLLERDPELSPKQQQHVEVIRRNGDHLLDLLNDILEMSKIEAGHQKLAEGPVDLWALVDDIERMFRQRADAERLSFEVDRAAEVPRHIVGDGGKLRQILVNLLGNAVKFTKRGGVVARLRVEPEVPVGDTLTPPEEGVFTLSAEVEDTGPGIGPEEMAALFRPFAQARAGVVARGGTGLGLAISREFARMMGGDITVESRVGEGSIFRLDVPITLGEGAMSLRPAPPSGRVVGILRPEGPIRILVTDDDDDSRTWLLQLLRQIGFEVRAAGNGAEAVTLTEQWKPHVVLMDMNMPVMDGYAAMRAIRAEPWGQGVAIVAVTATAFDEERAAIFEAGAQGWVRKPCREAELLEEIRRLVGIEFRYAKASARGATPAPFAAVRQPPSLASLPPEVSAEIRKAAYVADYDRLNELITALAPRHALAAEELRRLVARFAYEEIEAAVRAYS
jgi:CheY-like chemotaxis protein